MSQIPTLGGSLYGLEIPTLSESNTDPGWKKYRSPVKLKGYYRLPVKGFGPYTDPGRKENTDPGRKCCRFATCY